MYPGQKVVLKDFDYCKRYLSEGNGGYKINLPEKMRPYFELPYVTIKEINSDFPSHFFIEERSHGIFNLHRDWIKFYHLVPEHLFVIE